MKPTTSRKEGKKTNTLNLCFQAMRKVKKCPWLLKPISENHSRQLNRIQAKKKLVANLITMRRKVSPGTWMWMWCFSLKSPDNVFVKREEKPEVWKTHVKPNQSLGSIPQVKPKHFGAEYTHMIKLFKEMIYIVSLDHQELMPEYFPWLGLPWLILNHWAEPVSKIL